MRHAALALILATACSSPATPTAETGPTSPAAVETTAPAPTAITGLVSDVRQENGDVVSFVVDADGMTLQILIDPEIDYGFDLRHLEEHRKQGDPVEVELQERDGLLYAVSILDA